MRRRKLLVALLALVMCMTFSMSNMAFAATIETKGYTFEKLSNPTKTNPKDADGLVDGGNRLNSYAWSMAELKDEYGDYLYIGSNNNVICSVVDQMAAMVGAGDSVKMLKDLIKFGTNDDIPTTSQTASYMFRYNINTEKIEKFFTNEGGNGFRAATTFRGSVYMNEMTPEGAKILRIKDNKSQPEVVVGGAGFGGNIRAMNVSKNGKTMYLGGVMLGGDKYDLKPIVMSTTDGTNFKTIADYKEPVFKKYIKKGAGYCAEGNDVWDIVEFDGKLYLTLVTYKGSVVFQGSKSKSGWKWKELAGENKKNLTKKHYKAGFGNSKNLTITPYVFKNKIYFITFTDPITPMANAFMNLAAAAATGDLNPFFNSFKDMEAGMKAEASIFRMNKKGKVEMVVGDKAKCPKNIKYSAKKGSGFNNKKLGTTFYIWRAAVYNGKLYIGTFDATTLFRYITNLADGKLINSPEAQEMFKAFGIKPEQITAMLSKLDPKALERFKKMSDVVSSNKNPGFEFYVTKDGINYDTLSLNGFNDEYNYGVRTLVPTDSGLYMGTANPFYGAQLWRIKQK